MLEVNLRAGKTSRYEFNSQTTCFAASAAVSFLWLRGLEEKLCVAILFIELNKVEIDT